MGADLVLTHKGESVAGLGRSYNYYSDILLDMENDESAHIEVENKVERARSIFIKRLFINMVAKTPTNINEMYDMLDGIMDDYEKVCLKAGRTSSIINCIDDFGDLDIEEHF